MKYIKKDRPEGGASRRSVQGLAPENDCKNIIAQFSENASPVREEVMGLMAFVLTRIIPWGFT